MANPGDAQALSADEPQRRADLRAAGVTDSQLRRRHTRLIRGHWLHGAIQPQLRHFLVAALQRAPDDAFLCRQTAADLHGGIIPSSGVVHVGTTSGRRVRVAGMTVHRYAHRPEVVDVDGLPVTVRTQTFADLAPVLGLVELVVLGDSLSRHDHSLPGELLRHASGASGRGIVLARRAAALVRVGAESAQESRSRLLMVLAGLPEPVLQHPMYDDHGRELHRLDMAYLEGLLAVEYDGEHHLDRAQRDLDLRRRERFEAVGWRFVTVVSADIYQRPGAFLERTAEAMRARGMAVPYRLNPVWQLHFRP